MPTPSLQQLQTRHANAKALSSAIQDMASSFQDLHKRAFEPMGAAMGPGPTAQLQQDPTTGLLVDPQSGQMYDPQSGQPIPPEQVQQLMAQAQGGGGAPPAPGGPPPDPNAAAGAPPGAAPAAPTPAPAPAGMDPAQQMQVLQMLDSMSSELGNLKQTVEAQSAEIGELKVALQQLQAENQAFTKLLKSNSPMEGGSNGPASAQA